MNWNKFAEKSPEKSGIYLTKVITKKGPTIAPLYFNELEDSFMTFTDVGGTDCIECGGYSNYYYGSMEYVEYWMYLDFSNVA